MLSFIQCAGTANTSVCLLGLQAVKKLSGFPGLYARACGTAQTLSKIDVCTPYSVCHHIGQQAIHWLHQCLTLSTIQSSTADSKITSRSATRRVCKARKRGPGRPTHRESTATAMRSWSALRISCTAHGPTTCDRQWYKAVTAQHASVCCRPTLM